MAMERVLSVSDQSKIDSLSSDMAVVKRLLEDHLKWHKANVTQLVLLLGIATDIALHFVGGG